MKGGIDRGPPQVGFRGGPPVCQTNNLKKINLYLFFFPPCFPAFNQLTILCRLLMMRP